MVYVIGVVAAFFLVWGYLRLFSAAQENFEAAVKAANSSGTNVFPMRPVLGGHGVGMVFDLNTRQALYVNGKQWQVFEASHFLRWYTDFRQAPNGNVSRVKVIVDTRSFDQPRLTFGVQSLRVAEDWVARLAAFVNAR